MPFCTRLLCCTGDTSDARTPNSKKSSSPTIPPSDYDGKSKNELKRDNTLSPPVGNSINFMLLGTAGSGKSTIFKQFDKMFQTDLFTGGRSESVEAIKEFIRASFLRLTRLLRENYEYESEDLQLFVGDLQDSSKSVDIFDNLNDNALNNLVQIWTIIKSELGSQICQQESEFYFMEKLQDCLSPNFMPTDDDYLRCRVETQRSERRRYENVSFGKQNWVLTLTDVRGNKDDRRSWFSSFEDVDYFLYISSLADYNLCMEEDTSRNRLKDSLETFGEVLESLKTVSSFNKKSVIVLLNKEDSFKEKIRTDPLENHFTHFRPNKTNDVTEGKYFIKSQFVQIARKKGLDEKMDVKFTSAIDRKFGDKIIQSLLKNVISDILKN